MNTINRNDNGLTWDNGLSEESLKMLNKKSQSHSDIETKWAEIQTDYRHRYPELANEDLSYEPQQFDMLTKHIAQKTLRTPEEVREEIQNWKPSLYKRYDY